jgi:hypothetical protein
LSPFSNLAEFLKGEVSELKTKQNKNKNNNTEFWEGKVPKLRHQLTFTKGARKMTRVL